jgi:hypothetical protein
MERQRRYSRDGRVSLSWALWWLRRWDLNIFVLRRGTKVLAVRSGLYAVAEAFRFPALLMREGPSVQVHSYMRTAATRIEPLMTPP